MSETTSIVMVLGKNVYFCNSLFFQWTGLIVSFDHHVVPKFGSSYRESTVVDRYLLINLYHLLIMITSNNNTEYYRFVFVKFQEHKLIKRVNLLVC